MPALPRPASGPGSRYTARAATTRTRPAHRPRAVDVAALARRLTSRDQWLVTMVNEHRVLTTHQLARLAFTSLRSAQRRLRVLHQENVLDSFRPLTQTGSAPEHYTLGPAGAALLAAHAGVETADIDWRPTHTGRIAFSPSLGHDLGVNDLFTLLAARGHHDPSTGLALWLSERSCARRWSDLVRPDAYAHWREANQLLPFFLEYDTGSQPLARVEAKLAGYAAFTTATSTRPAVLIHTRTATREAALRQRLTEPARQLGTPLATASADHTTNTPWGPWWLPADAAGRRTNLTGLAGRWPALSEAAGLESTDADTPLTLPVPPLPPRSSS